MSQSNAYRFFPSKRAFIEALGERWFAEIEQEVARIAAADLPPAVQLVRYMVRQYEIKRARYAADPALFSVYLELGLANMGVVERHLKRLHGELVRIMRRCAAAGILGGREPEEAAALAEAMTTRFRDPGQIMRFYRADSPKRVAEAVRIILAGLAARGAKAEE
jgi:AcrR family transcriptional regulator